MLKATGREVSENSAFVAAPTSFLHKTARSREGQSSLSLDAMPNANADPFTPLIEAIAERVAALLRPQLKADHAVRPRLLTMQQAAVYLGRSENAVRCMEKLGKLPVVRADGRVMFDVVDLDRWIESGKN
jgi:hypothetical protein